MKKTILLVDDDHSERELFKEAVLEVDPDISYLSAEDGTDALTLLTSIADNLPDVIFMDINMPGMNGWTCLIKIKDDERFQNIPVIMYSTSNHQRDVDIAMEYGALCFCVKPENYKTLTYIIKVVSENLGENLLNALREYKTSLPNFKE
ncbi:MAG TPA: response regulator [Bacteroidia bacterium]|jgi:CheY-like chemotaxis protein|nr:response regulator [Bacteroidia bacterium]